MFFVFFWLLCLINAVEKQQDHCARYSQIMRLRIAQKMKVGLFVYVFQRSILIFNEM